MSLLWNWGKMTRLYRKSRGGRIAHEDMKNIEVFVVWIGANNHCRLPPPHRNSMSTLSWLLLTRFGPNFKHKFLGLSWTDFYCRSEICPGDICPHQEYLSCYWPNFDETFKVGSWDHLEQISTFAVTFVQETFFPATFVHIRSILAFTVPILTRLYI